MCEEDCDLLSTRLDVFLYSPLDLYEMEELRKIQI
jgi:hypothetical protein